LVKNGPFAKNYNLTGEAGYELKGDITLKNISINGGTASKTYDGTTAATVTGLTFSGLAEGESLALNTDYTINSGKTYSSADAGSRTVTLTAALKDTKKANNYKLTNSANYSLTGQIAQAVLKIDYLNIQLPVNATQPTADWVYYDDKPHSAYATLKSPYTIGAGAHTVKYNGNAKAPHEPGEYVVTLDVDGKGNFKSGALVVGKFRIFQAPNPVIVRSVFIPLVSGITTDPIAGEYMLYSGGDFRFTILAPVNGMPKVTTGRASDEAGGVSVKKNEEDGSYSVVIHEIRQNIVLTIVVNEDLSGPSRNEIISSNRVWSSGNNLYIEAAGSGQVQIYALTGALVKTLAVSAGENVERITLPKGIYIVRLEGKSYKIRF
jgi:hypothetical protein